jgi:CDP-diacylglycerol--glycerol-3-phosphate 3-phosphatidyltransferase
MRQEELDKCRVWLAEGIGKSLRRFCIALITIELRLCDLASALLSSRSPAFRRIAMIWTPNKITLLRVGVGFLAVSLFGRNAWMNLFAVGLTATAIALDALDGHIARTRKMATPVGAQIDILGDRMIENMYFTYFAVVGMVSLWLPLLFFARGATTDFLRGLAMRAGHSGWGANAILQNKWAQILVASRWSRGAYATLKCTCFCYLGLELALTRGPVALLGPVTVDLQAAIRAGAQSLAWTTAVFCVVRGLPVLLGGWKYFAEKMPRRGAKQHPQGDMA